jgi:sugar phosphate isomerase/epimerase
MRLSVASWSFPACTLAEAAAIAKALGLDGIDLGYRHRPAIDRSRVLAEPRAYAAELRAALPVEVANVWHLFGADRTIRQLAGPPDPRNLPDLRAALDFCLAVGAPTLFLLPGILGPGQSRAAAMVAAVAALGPMVHAAQGAGVTLTVEPHVQAWLESPSMTLDLVRELPGLKLTLDPAHFACLGYTQDVIEALCPHVGHVHLRQARPGVLQCRLDDGTLNFPAFLAALRDAGYAGWLAIEYLNQPYMGTTRDDVLLETIRMRDLVRDWSGQG